MDKHPDSEKNMQYAKKFIAEFIKKIENDPEKKLDGMRVRLSGEDTDEVIVIFSYCTRKTTPNYATPQSLNIDHKYLVDFMRVLYYQYREITMKGNTQ